MQEDETYHALFMEVSLALEDDEGGFRRAGRNELPAPLHVVPGWTMHGGSVLTVRIQGVIARAYNLVTARRSARGPTEGE